MVKFAIKKIDFISSAVITIILLEMIYVCPSVWWISNCKNDPKKQLIRYSLEDAYIEFYTNMKRLSIINPMYIKIVITNS